MTSFAAARRSFAALAWTAIVSMGAACTSTSGNPAGTPDASKSTDVPAGPSLCSTRSSPGFQEAWFIEATGEKGLSSSIEPPTNYDPWHSEYQGGPLSDYGFVCVVRRPSSSGNGSTIAIVKVLLFDDITMDGVRRSTSATPASAQFSTPGGGHGTTRVDDQGPAGEGGRNFVGKAIWYCGNKVLDLELNWPPTNTNPGTTHIKTLTQLLTSRLPCHPPFTLR